MRCKSLGIMALGLVSGLASVSVANPILTFGFTDLAGSFDATSGALSAVAVDNGPELQTAGDVTRLAAPGGTANFDAGFVSRSAFADVNLSMTVTPIDAMSASGMGSLSITDDDGDIISAVLNGTFTTPGAGITYFTGYLTDVSVSGTTFNGTDGGSFDADLPGEPPYEGAVVQLFINSAGGFFDADFNNESIQISGLIVPTPGSMALLGLGGLASIRRRRN